MLLNAARNFIALIKLKCRPLPQEPVRSGARSQHLDHRDLLLQLHRPARPGHTALEGQDRLRAGSVYYDGGTRLMNPLRS